ncbi:MAG TPA: hypothetical protein VFN05_18695 [Actinomycetes bacterium]|nr:hypothetical protein [Actinomycetes bacterium]
MAPSRRRRPPGADAALAELATLHPDNPAVPRVRAAAVDWQAALDPLGQASRSAAS